MTTLQVRIDPTLKKKAQKIAEQLGMDLSTSIKIFLIQMVRWESIPFEVRTENGFTLREEKKLLQDIEASKMHGKSYASANELFEDILGKNWREENRKNVARAARKKV